MSRDGAANGDESTASAPADEPVIDPRLRSAILWGLVGALSFGVLYQAHVLLGGRFDATVLVGGAVVVGVVTTVLAARLERRLSKESL